MNGYYFDGNRLYVSVLYDKIKLPNELNSKSFYINSENYKKSADIYYDSKELEPLFGEKRNICLFVFNSFDYDRGKKYYISYNDFHTSEFSVEGNF